MCRFRAVGGGIFIPILENAVGIFSGMFRGKSDKERDGLIERASRTQVGLLPNSIPRLQGYDVQVHSQSAKALSGDYYDFLLDEESDRMESVIMDVSGKDFPASITVSQLAGALYILFQDFTTPLDEKLAQLNAMMFERTRRETFVTAMLMRLDYNRHTLSFANAGHNPLIIAGGGSKIYEKKGVIAPAIGFVDDKKFRTMVKTTEIEMQPEMLVFSYTDGLNEAMDPKRNEYTTERLISMVDKYKDKDLALMVRSIQQDLLHHQDGIDPSDDQTVIAIKRLI